jgi:outer membrane protein OmpA-like peptidoglycan-associated protein
LLPRLRALVRGHADRRGSNIENTPLSQARAAAVGLALQATGVAADRIEVVGEGSDKPLDGAENVVAFARNRRVEIVFSLKEPR